MGFWTKERAVDTREVAARIGTVYKKKNGRVNPILVTVSGRGLYG
jgi:hypothetical protein